MSLARLALPAVLLAAACAATPEDPHHCGAQGYDCLGGACSSGVCGPVTLVSGIKSGFALTVDSTHVYWVDGSNVSRVSKSGGPATLLGTVPRIGLSIATDGTYAYVAAFETNGSVGGGIYRIPTDGSAVTLLDAANLATLVAVDPNGCVDWSYWGDPNKPGAIARLCPGSTKPEILADETGQMPTSLAVDATGTFWSDNGPFIITSDPCAEAPGALRMVSPPSSPVTLARGYFGGYGLGTSSLGTGLAAAGDAMYWRDMCSGTVYRLPHGASSPMALAAVASTPAAGGYYYSGLVTADALGAYVISDAGVVRVPKDGGPAVLVAAGQSPVAMAVDDTRIYLLAFTGALVAVAKPPR